MGFLRRELLAVAGLVALQGRRSRAAPSSTPHDENVDREPVAPSTGHDEDAGDEDWADARALFPLDLELVHLSSFLLASHPQPVRDAVERHRRALDRDPVGYANGNHDRLDSRVRRAAARYLEVDPADVFLTDSTTMGLGLVYSGLKLEPGDELLTTEHEHHSTLDGLRIAAERSGAVVRRVVLYDRRSARGVDRIAETIAGALRPETRVLALTWVHSSSGVKLPLERIAAVVAEANRGRSAAARVLLCVDGVHGLGVEDATPASLGCDVFVAGTHKSLYGPRGTGIVWVRRRARDKLAALIPSFTADDGWGGAMTPGGFHSFEHRWALAEAFELHLALGKRRITARIHTLARRLKAGLSEIPGVSVVTPLDDGLSASIVAFHVEGMRAGDVVRALRRRGIVATVAPYEDRAVRLAPAFFNTAAEIDRAVQALSALRA